MKVLAAVLVILSLVVSACSSKPAFDPVIEVGALTTQVNAFQDKFDKLNQQFSTLQSNVATNTNNVSVVNSKLSTQTTDVTQLKGQMTALAAQLSSIQKQLESIRTAATPTPLPTTVNATQKQLEGLKASGEALQTRVDSLFQTVTSLPKVTDPSTKIDTLTSNVGGLSAKVDSVTQSQNALKSSVQDLQKQLADLRTTIATNTYSNQQTTESPISSSGNLLNVYDNFWRATIDPWIANIRVRGNITVGSGILDITTLVPGGNNQVKLVYPNTPANFVASIGLSIPPDSSPTTNILIAWGDSSNGQSTGLLLNGYYKTWTVFLNGNMSNGTSAGQVSSTFSGIHHIIGFTKIHNSYTVTLDGIMLWNAVGTDFTNVNYMTIENGSADGSTHVRYDSVRINQTSP